MNKLARTFMTEDSGVSFSDSFNVSQAHQASGAHLINNFYNNWNWYTYWGLGNNYYIVPPYFNGSELFLNSDQGENIAVSLLVRSLEGYNVYRSFDMQCSYQHLRGFDTNGPYSKSGVVISVGGSAVTLDDQETYGLSVVSRYQCTYGGDNSHCAMTVRNNGTIIGTPYTYQFGGVVNYLFIQKRGNQIGVTLNTTGVKPTTPEYTYTITDFTSLSNALLIYCWGRGYGDYCGGIKFYDFSEVFY